jgi:O-methyltransferase
MTAFMGIRHVVRSMVLRAPAVRGLAAENRRLRQELARTQQRITILEEERRGVDELMHDVRVQEKQLIRLRADHAAQGMPEGERQLLLRKAVRFEHLWYNAQKKIDLLQIEPFATLARYARRKRRTYLHFDRLYTLWQGLMSMPAEAQAVIEIGVHRGGSARFIGDTLRAFGRELPFYVCDTFKGHVVVDPEVDGRHAVGKQFSRVDVAQVAEYLQDLPFIRLLEGDIRETSAHMAAEYAFGFVHLDVDVYPVTRFCLDFFGARLVPGAMLVVDDYGFKTCPGAKRAVDEFVAANPRFRLLHLLTGQAVLVPLAGA